MHRKYSAFICILLIAAVLTACGRGPDAGSEVDGTAAEKKFVIVTSFYPIYVMTANLTKGVENVQIVNMTEPQTGCLHDYSLTPSDMRLLEKADIFVINGAGMEAFMDKVIRQQKNLRIVEASKGLELLNNEDGELNPHLWVSISGAILQVKNTASQLADIDKDNSARYLENAEEYCKKLTALKDRMHTELRTLKGKEIITFHEAFPYFAKEFGLKTAAVIEREPGTAPSPKELVNIIGILKASDIKVIFAEPQYSIKAAETIARESGAKIYHLDPVVTGDAEAEGVEDAYINAMEKNLKTLIEALGNG